MEHRRAMDGRVKKRKAETLNFNDDRLSKKLSTLNLDHNADHLHASVEQRPNTLPALKTPERQQVDDDTMRLDDTKHKVYIYDLDKELEEIESSDDENKLVFLPDIEKRLLNRRIPSSILANKDGELAGMNQSQAMVLYDIPHSLTLTDEKDSVRKAILESRRRAQEELAVGRPEDHEETPGILADQSASKPLVSARPLTNNNVVIGPTVEPMAVEEGEAVVMDLD
ncbi:hypothetical protein GMDG_07658 [Pseudogymnoascus destructans 20631-21]|uniref:Uncharacterized protein n=2 Tax=Pseudogymnoascus destructans TaxID=655981 RepID=L8FY02_PSED2|nr:hypothetical protein GMDG_07658 [Pseudogymnoascus destructans 20631-21]